MKTAGVWLLRPLTLLICALILSVSSFSQLSSKFPSNATYVTIFSLGSLTGKIENDHYCGVITLGEASVVTSASSSELRTESGLLAMLLLLYPTDGDINRDGYVNYQDLFILRMGWQRIHQNDPWLTSSDLDSNGIIDHHDLFLFMSSWHSIEPVQYGISRSWSFSTKQSLSTTSQSSGGSER